MVQPEKKQHSIGHYSVLLPPHRQNFGVPERRTQDDKVPLLGLKIPDTSFIIPMPSNTGTLETSWHLGGMTRPKRAEFEITQIDWDKKVVCPLEQHIHKVDRYYSGKATFHFNDGYILNVDGMN